MLFKSQVFTQASGSVGGLTYGRNRGGMYTRGRGLVTNPNTSAQQAVRAALGTASSAWRGLALEQRQGWIAYATNTPTVNALGDPLTLTGQQMFVRTNTPMINAGLPIITDAPETFGGTTLSPVLFTALAGTPGREILDFLSTDEWANDDDGKLFVYSSLPMSDSIEFFKGPFWRTQVISGSSTLPPTLPALFNLIRPTSPPSNVSVALLNKLIIRLVAQTGDGRQSQPQILSAIAAAAPTFVITVTDVAGPTVSKAGGVQSITLTGTNLRQPGMEIQVAAGATVFGTNLTVNAGGTSLTCDIDATSLTIGAATVSATALGNIGQDTTSLTVVA